jgi:hypothetical protein
MNQYGNKFGFHSPKQTETTFNILTKIFPNLNWEDGSWHNDTCDSIYLELEDDYVIHIYVPNSDVTDLGNEEFNTYSLMVNDEDYADETYPTIESVIDVLKIILKKYLISTITNRIKDTHNEQDIADLQTFSLEELQEIQNDLIDA